MKFHDFLTLTAAGLVFLCNASIATADIYKYRGPDGRLIISNTPPPAAVEVEKKSVETMRSYTSKPAPDAPSPRPQPVKAPALQTTAPADHHLSEREKRDRAAAAAAKWKNLYEAAHRKFGNARPSEIARMLNSLKERLRQRDTEHNIDDGSNAIYECERQYWNKRSQMACLYAHYGG